MASVTINVPDEIIPRLRPAMRAKFPELSGLSDANAFKEATAAYWRGILIEYEEQQARGTAQQEAEAIVVAAKQAAEADSQTIT